MYKNITQTIIQTVYNINKIIWSNFFSFSFRCLLAYVFRFSFHSFFRFSGNVPFLFSRMFV